jgi:GAF domain-containing protein
MFIIVVSIYYFERRNQLLKEYETQVGVDLNELLQFVEINLKRDRDVLNLAVNIAEYKINRSSDIEQFENNQEIFNALDPYTNEPLELKINEWKVDGLKLINNYQIVDDIKKIANADVSLYQKCDRGYVNVSSSIVNTAGERLLGDIMLNASPITKTVEAGNQYIDRFHSKSAWYLVSYKPIVVNGKIQGIYYIGIRERLGAALKNVFEQRKYFESGYPFLIAENGNLLVHPTKQGENFSGTNLYKSIINKGKLNRFLQYRWPETGGSKNWNLHYKYHEQTKSYACITYPANEFNRELNMTILFALLGYVLFFILIQLVFIFFMRSLKEKLKLLRQVLNRLSKGERVTDFNLQGEKEFVEISKRIVDISNRYNVLTNFAQGLANDNYSQTYPKSFINDEVGESLIKINDKLNEAMYNEHIRQKEEKLRTWESEGLSKFVNILQRNRDKLEELCYELISNLVEYLNANLGALFFLNNEDPNDIHFMQMATYAYEQKKIISKKIYPEQGLIGRVFNEKETIFLSEIPDDYISITSGLGEGRPKNLLIVPLLINKEVYGAIEIASFNIIKGFQIEFIEKIGENIASTINNVLVNNKTRELLEQSRAQSELLSAQEDKMRKNLIELKNIQKESESGIHEMKDFIKLFEDVLLIVELNAKGEILSVNHHLSRFFNMEKSSLIGKHYSDYSNFVPVDEYKGLINSWSKLVEGKQVQLEIKVKSGMGKMKNVLLNMIPELDKDHLQKIVILGIELTDK